MGCYIGLTHTITHHLHLTGTEAKTEIACVCAREEKRVATATERCRDTARGEYLCVRLLLNWMGGRAEVQSRLYWIIKRNRVTLITRLLLSPPLVGLRY